uniref:Neural/ectodermal development factor IMP-L2 n=1 Tax=Ascaris lumbricoides TaxID=6252 RepID=A0A0M3HSX4_ASCLU
MQFLSPCVLLERVLSVFTWIALLGRPLRASLPLVQRPPSTIHTRDEFARLNANLDKEQLLEKAYVRITKKPETVLVSGGESFELRCEAIGVPPPIISWSISGKPLLMNYDNNIIEKLHNIGHKTIQNGVTATKLRVPCAKKRHQGVYSCHAGNAHESVEANATVAVEGQSRSCSRKSPSSPIITMWSDGRFENSGLAVQLFCRASGMPDTQISWYDEEHRLLNHNSKYEVLENGDLLIRNAQWDDMGGYSCVASNQYGEDRVSTFFYPTEP